jgi:hypothetical protein
MNPEPATYHDVESGAGPVEPPVTNDEPPTPWPMGNSDGNPPAGPLIFNPQGFLVLILEDAGEADLAKAALQGAGFAENDLRVYSGQQILADHDRYMAQRSVTRRVVRTLTDDRATIELYFGYARQGRAALWVRAPDRADADRALRNVADQRVLHVRYYGHHSQDDIHLR